MNIKNSITAHAFRYPEIMLLHTIIKLGKQKHKMGPGTHMGTLESKVQGCSMCTNHGHTHSLVLNPGEKAALRILMDDYVLGMVDHLMLLEDDMKDKHLAGSHDAGRVAAKLYFSLLPGALAAYGLATEIKFALSH